MKAAHAMKNQYFGDVNDYLKYGLLRAIQSEGHGTLLVAWMLTPDDDRRDGSRRSYLRQADKWSKYDPALFSGLGELLAGSPQPSVSLIEQSGLIPRASYFSSTVRDERRERREWGEQLLRVAAGVDLVFVDPDNGIEVPSKPVGRKDSSKYVAWKEIEALFGAGCSVLIYQHFPREEREKFAARLGAMLRARTGAFVTALATSHVIYLMAVQNRHIEYVRNAFARIEDSWGGALRSVSLPSPPP